MMTVGLRAEVQRVYNPLPTFCQRPLWPPTLPTRRDAPLLIQIILAGASYFVFLNRPPQALRSGVTHLFVTPNTQSQSFHLHL